MHRFLWRNIPIPESFVAALLLGGLFQVVFPMSIPLSSAGRIALGIILVLASLAMVIWAVSVAGDQNLELPSFLLTGGPYAFSRNPMYLSWGMAVIGIALLFNALWLIISALLASLYLNFVTIPSEERWLQGKFATEYTAYRHRIRRWL